MKHITKDTPIGTRVLVVWDDFKRLSAEPFLAHVASLQGERVECRRPDGSVFAARRSNVFVDEPAPGTWAWACEMAIAGNVPVRPLGDGSYNRLIYTEGSDELSMQCCTHGTYIEESIGRFDVDATNWEIGK